MSQDSKSEQPTESEIESLTVFGKTLFTSLYAWFAAWLLQNWWWPIPATCAATAIFFGVATVVVLGFIMFGFEERVAKAHTWVLLLWLVSNAVAWLAVVGVVYEWWWFFEYLVYFHLVWFGVMLAIITAVGVVYLVPKLFRYVLGAPEYKEPPAQN